MAPNSESDEESSGSDSTSSDSGKHGERDRKTPANTGTPKAKAMNPRRGPQEAALPTQAHGAEQEAAAPKQAKPVEDASVLALSNVPFWQSTPMTPKTPVTARRQVESPLAARTAETLPEETQVKTISADDGGDTEPAATASSSLPASAAALPIEDPETMNELAEAMRKKEEKEAVTKANKKVVLDSKFSNSELAKIFNKKQPAKRQKKQ